MHSFTTRATNSRLMVTKRCTAETCSEDINKNGEVEVILISLICLEWSPLQQNVYHADYTGMEIVGDS